MRQANQVLEYCLELVVPARSIASVRLDLGWQIADQDDSQAIFCVVDEFCRGVDVEFEAVGNDQRL